jgi:hypothetical protein
MSEVNIIGIDIGKRVFHLHGERGEGSVVFRKKFFRGKVLGCLPDQPICVLAMETCATAHGSGREFEKLGHDVRLCPPIYVKPFVRHQKNDAVDAEAIIEAALRPTMRLVAVKTEDRHARAMLFRTRQMFVGQRTRMINALRGHLAEHGLVAATGTAQLKHLADAIQNSETALPEDVRDLGQMCLAQIAGLNARVAELDQKMRSAAKKADVARLFLAMPGVGPITALAIKTFAPDLATFRRGRDFAAWLLGLVPKQLSTDGKARLGKTSKMGQHDIHTLLVSGAMAVLQAVERFDTPNNGWLTRLRARQPRMVVAISLADKMARGL